MQRRHDSDAVSSDITPTWPTVRSMVAIRRIMGMRARVTGAAVAAVLCAAITSPALAEPAGVGRAQGNDGLRLTVSPVRGLSPQGATVRVRGAGFDRSVGIYVALCVTPVPGQRPSPCGGGVNMSASDPSSAWVSSTPPPYGRSLAIPYRAGGRFDVRITVSSVIGDVDCRRTSCSIVTRADHTRSGDRRFDLAVPVTFEAGQ